MVSPQKTVGVFALQGDVREHAHVLGSLGARTRPVRRPADLEGLDGIVLPGGESSVMDRLARIMGLKDPLIAALRDGLPAYGTCAGLIMLARVIRNPAPDQGGLGVLDVASGTPEPRRSQLVAAAEVAVVVYLTEAMGPSAYPS